LRPKQHEFLYRVFYFYLDLGELDAVSRKLQFFGVNRPGLWSLRDQDHFQYGEKVRPIADNVREFLDRSGCPLEKGGSIRMLCFPRLLGYTFNPITIYFCFGADGSPWTSIVEVGNTFHELKPYLVPLSPGGDSDFEIRVPKEYYVSPFSSVDLEFHFRFQLPGDQLRVYIDDYDATGKVLISTLTGTRREMTLSRLVKLTVKFPLLTFRVMWLIHWQALRLWLKRIPYFMKESRADEQRNVFRPHKSLKKLR
jgi:DUF1365 family protein